MSPGLDPALRSPHLRVAVPCLRLLLAFAAPRLTYRYLRTAQRLFRLSIVCREPPLAWVFQLIALSGHRPQVASKALAEEHQSYLHLLRNALLEASMLAARGSAHLLSNHWDRHGFLSLRSLLVKALLGLDSLEPKLLLMLG